MTNQARMNKLFFKGVYSRKVIVILSSFFSQANILYIELINLFYYEVK